jgi:hypothetical protein
MDLPPEVNERYQSLARERGWPPEVKSAFLESVAWIRHLDEGTGSRSYYDRVDDEGAVDACARWLWETVESDGSVVAIKQIEVARGGRVRRYSWRHASLLTSCPQVRRRVSGPGPQRPPEQTELGQLREGTPPTHPQ